MSAKPIAFRARYVVPVDQPAIEGGVVQVLGRRIVHVGRSADVPPDDLGEVALIPGLVNAHTHLEFSHLEAPLGTQDESIAGWIPRVIQARLEGPARLRSIAKGLSETLAGGATLVGEIARPGLGLDAYQSFAGTLLAFRELIGPTPKLASALSLEPEGEPPEGVVSGLAPHAPYTVHPILLDRALAASADRRAPLAMHLAESPEEVRFLAEGNGALADLLRSRGFDVEAVRGGYRRPGDYLPRLACASKALVVHGNYLSEADYGFLAERRESMSLVHCPRTHRRFGHPRFPMARLLNAGVRVVLGTDSRASNPDLSMLAELRFAAAAQPDVAPDALLGMATCEGARALGQPGRGRLVVGAPAELAAIEIGPKDEPVEAIVRGSGRLKGVFLGDRWAFGPGNCLPRMGDPE